MVRAMNDKNNDDNMERSSIPKTPTSPLDLSIHSKQYPFRAGASSPSTVAATTSEMFSRQMSIDDVHEPPEIITQPKEEWHYRSIKDLAKNHLPYLAGIGPQRTPIRVTVPKTHDVPMYLAIAIMTIENEPHPSKVIVPAKTHVNTEYLSHDNNLECLQFDRCSPTDKFDPESRNIYSEINFADHQRGYKEVRVHMFNLYQSHSITKDMIISKQLNQCKLAFWLCVRRDTEYIAVSRPSFSSIIEEKKMSSRSRTSDLIIQPTQIPFPYSSFCIDYNNNDEDEMNGDDST